MTSSASILGNSASPESDHVAIVRHVRFNETLHGGWDEWSVACICGGLYEPKYNGWYIPSKVQAERIFNAHAGVGERPEEQEESTADASPTEYLAGYREDATLYD